VAAGTHFIKGAGGLAGDTPPTWILDSARRHHRPFRYPVLSNLTLGAAELGAFVSIRFFPLATWRSVYLYL